MLVIAVLSRLVSGTVGGIVGVSGKVAVGCGGWYCGYQC